MQESYICSNIAQNISWDNSGQIMCALGVRFSLRYDNKIAVYRLELYHGLRMRDNG